MAAKPDATGYNLLHHWTTQFQVIPAMRMHGFVPLHTFRGETLEPRLPTFLEELEHYVRVKKSHGSELESFNRIIHIDSG